MKKIFLLFITILILTTGCYSTNNLEDATIYTTVYPITYLTDYLYGSHATIDTIYPTGANISSYKLTKKQIAKYAKADVFIYNGLANEKEIAKDFLNKNKHLLLIDVSYGLNYKNELAELWLSPNNFLMLAKNIQESLNNYLDNKFGEEEINQKYQELEEKVSFMDAKLRSIVMEAKETNKSTTLVVANNLFKYLENYGFTVISLEEQENLTTNNLNAIKSNFKNSNYTAIIMSSLEEKTELINSLVDDYKAKIITIDPMYTLTADSINQSEDYFSIMEEYIDNIRSIIIK